MSGSKAGLILGIAAGVAIVAGIATAFLISYCCSGEDDGDTNEDGGWVAPPNGWLTYRDEEKGYEISYPPDWVIGESFHTFSPNLEILPQGDVGLALPRPTEVTVTVDFHIDVWCLGRHEVRRAVVSGYEGYDLVCYYDGPTPPCGTQGECVTVLELMRRTFEPGRGGSAYYVSGRGAEHSDTVRSIVESFRFAE